ncbi:MAG: hypothetical protein ACRDT0_20495 [Pseudonocardiaceae bacterium]
MEMLLIGWIPRKIVADVPYLAKAPDLLRVFIRFCHHDRGIRPELTDQTLGAVDSYAPEYQQTIRSARLQGPAALLATMGRARPGRRVARRRTARVHEIMLETLRRAVGGEDTLERLDVTALPDEPFAWDAIPADVHDRSDRGARARRPVL